jgi:hypothetical protein
MGIAQVRFGPERQFAAVSDRPLSVEHRAAEDCSSMAFFASDVASAQPASGSRSMAAALGSDRLHSTCCGDATANRKARARHG